MKGAKLKMGLKLDKDVVRTKNKAKFSQQILIIIGALILVAVVIVVNWWSSRDMRDTVEVAVFNTNVAQNAYINASMITKQEMTTADYKRSAIVKMSDGTERRQIVLYQDAQNALVGKYAANYIRANTPIYYDAVTTEYTKSNSYLYQMDGTELLKIDVDPKQFGDILVPGDKLNVRITYDETKYKILSEKDYLKLTDAERESLVTTTSVTELMFSEVTVLDMLNASGESIFDKYYALMSMPEAQQKKKFADDNFKTSIEPKCILIAVTPEEAERYSILGGKTKGSLITLLPRTTSNPILEAINSLTNGTAK